MVTQTISKACKPRKPLSTRGRNQLILDHLPLVKCVLKGLAPRLPRHVDREDLLEAGALGLLDATHRFNPSRNVRFQTYAVSRIRGAMLDSLRNEDWLPRSTRTALTRLAEARAQLEQKRGRPATTAEASKHLGFGEKKLARLARASENCVFYSLNDRFHSGEREDTDAALAAEDRAASPVDQAALEEQKQRLAAAMRGLPQSERLVITLYYFEQLRLRTIAETLRVTESRACQIHRAALARLQRVMAPRESVSEVGGV
jgi:RNA polymerase sigma factor for flagellar operon FliA